jgi:hypothetical protein
MFGFNFMIWFIVYVLLLNIKLLLIAIAIVFDRGWQTFEQFNLIASRQIYFLIIPNCLSDQLLSIYFTVQSVCKPVITYKVWNKNYSHRGYTMCVVVYLIEPTTAVGVSDLHKLYSRMKHKTTINQQYENNGFIKSCKFFKKKLKKLYFKLRVNALKNCLEL